MGVSPGFGLLQIRKNPAAVPGSTVLRCEHDSSIIDSEGTVSLRFRVDGVYQGKRFVVLAGEKQIFSRKRPALPPGEMETVRLKSRLILDCRDASEIPVKTATSTPGRS